MTNRAIPPTRTCRACPAWLGRNNRSGFCGACRSSYQCRLCNRCSVALRDKICPDCYGSHEVAARAPNPPPKAYRERLIAHYAARVAQGLPAFDHTAPLPDDAGRVPMTLGCLTGRAAWDLRGRRSHEAA